MKIAGNFDLHGKVFYYTNDFNSFCDEDGNKLSDDVLNEWAVCLNSPWSQTEMSYRTELNCKDAYTEMNKKIEPVWRTTYRVTGYDLIVSMICGYGNTPQESLENCILNFKKLQEKYNPDGKHF